MGRSIYIASAEGNTGKSTIALGMLDALSRQTPRVGVFRPVARNGSGRDYVLEMLLGHDGVDLDYDECVGVGYEDVLHDEDAALSTIVERYRRVEAKCDAVVIVGSDYTDVASPTELGFNARVAANLGSPVILVIGGRDTTAGVSSLTPVPARTDAELRRIAEAAMHELRDEHAQVIAVIVNRAERALLRQTVDAVAPVVGTPVWAIPEDQVLTAPTVRSVMDAVDGHLIAGDPEMLGREAMGAIVAGMTVENVLDRLTEGAVALIPGDRSEVLIAVMMAHRSETFPSLSGIILYGGFRTAAPVSRLLAGLAPRLPVITTRFGTYATVLRLTRTRGRLAAESPRKFDVARALFEQHVDAAAILAQLDVARTDVVTPLMFEYDLIDRARRDVRHIVLPEGDDPRVLRAASTVLSRGIAELTILGDPSEVRALAASLGVDIGAAHLVSPTDPQLHERFAHEFAALRAHRGITLDQARDTVTDPSYFGAMMVHLGLVDGMVSGATHTTADTLRPAFEIVRTSPGVTIASSVFLMALADRVLVYGDCAVVPDPTAEQLADIAISSAETARSFGIEPRVAMLSYSTGQSGEGADVDKVRRATELVQQRRPDLPVAGPIQYDAAVDAAVGASKMPGSDVAGRATVFVFPDLNTGNNTYKAVQRSAGAVAIGPVLQGLRKPVNDLSRGATVRDIVATIAITAIQAQTVAAQPSAESPGGR